uniref:Uncharacterized protein n=1 Tax=Jaculus jaculus TaxID=51337 RepID=A0A8C5KS49_JACJA
TAAPAGVEIVIAASDRRCWPWSALAAALGLGPVIYVQLDHSGGYHSDKINKSESVVYADIQKN